MGTGEERRMAVIVEDEVDIRHLLETVLTQAGFQVIATGNGPDGIEAVRRYDPIVTTLDVNMPGMDGFEVARRIREFSTTYIVMLTALHEEIDTLQGLEAGADDYITKPFRPREVRARIEAMLRRPRAVAAPVAAPHATTTTTTTSTSPTPVMTEASLAPTPTPTPAPAVAAPAEVAPTPAPVVAAPPVVPTVEPVPVSATVEAPAPTVAVAPAGPSQPLGSGWLEHNGLWLNLETHVVTKDSVELPLTRSEFDLLAALLQSGRRVRTKPDLVLLLRGESYVTTHFVSEADKRAIEVHLGNLRKKLGEDASSPRWIETVRGVGYRLTSPDGS